MSRWMAGGCALVFALLIFAAVPFAQADQISGSATILPSNAFSKATRANTECQKPKDDEGYKEGVTYLNTFDDQGIIKTSLWGKKCTYGKRTDNQVNVEGQCVAEGKCECKLYRDQDGKPQLCDDSIGPLPKLGAGTPGSTAGSKNPADVQEVAKQVVQNIDPTTDAGKEQLAKALQNIDPNLTTQAAQQIVERDPKAAYQLIKNIADGNTDVTKQQVEALGLNSDTVSKISTLKPTDLPRVLEGVATDAQQREMTAARAPSTFQPNPAPVAQNPCASITSYDCLSSVSSVVGRVGEMTARAYNKLFPPVSAEQSDRKGLLTKEEYAAVGEEIQQAFQKRGFGPEADPLRDPKAFRAYTEAAWEVLKSKGLLNEKMFPDPAALQGHLLALRTNETEAKFVCPGCWISDAGARGPYQITPATAKQFGAPDAFTNPQAHTKAAILAADTYGNIAEKRLGPNAFNEDVSTLASRYYNTGPNKQGFFWMNPYGETVTRDARQYTEWIRGEDPELNVAKVTAQNDWKLAGAGGVNTYSTINTLRESEPPASPILVAAVARDRGTEAPVPLSFPTLDVSETLLPSPRPAVQFDHDLSFRSHDPDVIRLQQRLIKDGYLQLPYAPTDYYYTLTRQAVIRYQAAHGLQQDGIVGWRTRAVLNR